jgi:hypothetical protein
LKLCVAPSFALGLVLALLTACETDDVGSACPEMRTPFEPGATLEGDVARAQSPEVVEFDVNFTCYDPVCVITLGHAPYCSRQCTRDSQCPAGFGCQVVMNVGPFEGESFCVWKECGAVSDCGDPWVMGCEPVPELSLEQETRFCGFRTL